MKILSHRGHWRTPSEQNTRAAFARSFSLGFGTETDIRDACGKLVIAHDMPSGEEMTLFEFLALYNTHCHGEPLPLALNVKADGLATELKAALDAASIDHAFVFDMSVPDMRAYFAAGVPVFTRMSEGEPHPVWLERAEGIWLDAFEREWYDNRVISSLRACGKQVCMVSPELHQRAHYPLWSQLRMLPDPHNLFLCTDFPEEALQFFGKDGVSP